MPKISQILRLPPRRLMVWHTVAAVPMGSVVLLGAFLSYHYHQLANENRDRIDHAYEVLDVVDGLFISLQNADVAQREFIVTGDPARLSTFQAALDAEHQDSERLRTLFVKSAAQEERLSKLDSAVSAKLAELGKTIGLREANGFESAREAILHGDTTVPMAEIRQQVVAMSDAERKLLAKRQAAVREHERDTLLVGIAIAALSVTTRVLIALGLKWMHRRKQEEAQEEGPQPA